MLKYFAKNLDLKICQYLFLKNQFYFVFSLIKIFLCEKVYNSPKIVFKNLCFNQISGICRNWVASLKETRREVILARLRADACYFSVKHHIREGTPRELCSVCNIRQTVYHLTLQCPHLTRYRLNIIHYFNFNNLSINMNNLLSDDFPFHLLFKFLKNVNYFNVIEPY